MKYTIRYSILIRQRPVVHPALGTDYSPHAMDSGQTSSDSIAPDAGPAEDLSGLPKRQAIVMAAKYEFMERGFAQATMDGIALRAGTTKRTIYNHFKNKEELFVGIVEFVSQRFLEKLPPPDRYSEDVAEALESYAARFCELTTWTDSVGLQRMILGEIGRFPELASQLYRTAVTEAERQLADYLKDRTRAGVLAVADSEQAAMHLLDLATGARRFRILFGVDEPIPGPPSEDLSPSAIDESIRKAVAVFLSHYRP